MNTVMIPSRASVVAAEHAWVRQLQDWNRTVKKPKHVHKSKREEYGMFERGRDMVHLRERGQGTIERGEHGTSEGVGTRGIRESGDNIEREGNGTFERVGTRLRES